MAKEQTIYKISRNSNSYKINSNVKKGHKIQAPKFCTLAIAIHRYRNLHLVVTIAKPVQESERQQKNGNIVLKTEDFRGKNQLFMIYQIRLKIFRKIRLKILTSFSCIFLIAAFS